MFLRHGGCFDIYGFRSRGSGTVSRVYHSGLQCRELGLGLGVWGSESFWWVSLNRGSEFKALAFGLKVLRLRVYGLRSRVLTIS